MWEELRPFLSTIGDVLGGIFGKVWVALKWLFFFLVAVASWLWKTLVLFVLVTYDLAVHHYYGLLAMVPILVGGFFITNQLQKKKSFVHIPWFQNPNIMTPLLVPVIISLLGLVVCGGPASIFQDGSGGLFAFQGVPAYLGAPGCLGIPTTIWSLLISLLMVSLMGMVALKQRKKSAPRVMESVPEDDDNAEMLEEMTDLEGEDHDAGYEVKKSSRVVDYGGDGFGGNGRARDKDGDEGKTTDDYIDEIIKGIDNMVKDK